MLEPIVRLHKAAYVAASLALPVVALPASAAEPSILTVEQAKGDVSLQRAGAAVTGVREGTLLLEGDRVTLWASAKLVMKLDRYGVVELGSGSALKLEQLPFSSYAEQRQTVLGLDTGYLRVLWKHPGATDKWPLQVKFAGETVGLGSGEFFFEDQRLQRLCVASGSVTLQRANQPLKLDGPACYRMIEGAAPEKTRREEADFIAMRNSQSIGTAPAQTATVKVTAAVPVVAKSAEPAMPVVVDGAPEKWNVNVISETDAGAAEAASNRLRSAGYVPVIEIAEIKGRQWHRVQVQGAPSRQAALKIASEIGRKLGYKKIWVLRDAGNY